MNPTPQVRIESDGAFFNTRVFVDDKPLDCVVSATITIKPKEVVTVALELDYVAVNTIAELREILVTQEPHKVAVIAPNVAAAFRWAADNNVDEDRVVPYTPRTLGRGTRGIPVRQIAYAGGHADFITSSADALERELRAAWPDIDLARDAGGITARGETTT